MFLEIFLREIKAGLKQPMVYVFLFIIGLLVFGAVVSDMVSIGGSIGAVYRNSPHTVIFFVIILTVFGTLISTAFFNNAALRDFSHDFDQILFSTPLKKSSYYFGRFFGALVLALIPYLGIYIAFILGTEIAPAMNWIPAERFGPTPWNVFLNSFLIFILPNTIITGVVVFALAGQFKNTLASFGGALFLLIGYVIASNFISDLENENLAAVIDFFGVSTYDLVSKHYTTVEKNTLSLIPEGVLLYNRIIWVFVAFILLLISYFTFSTKKTITDKKSKKKEEAIINGELTEQSFTFPQISQHFNTTLSFLQWKSIYMISFQNIIKSNLMKLLLLYAIIQFGALMWGGIEVYGLKSYPVTYKMLFMIEGAISILFVVSMVFYSGELVWEDREAKINEVIDATPHQSLISLSAKAFSIVSLFIILQIAMIFLSVGYQLLNGYTRTQLDVYFSMLSIDMLGYVIWTFVFILIQVLVNHKYLGYFVSILFIFSIDIIMSIFDLSSRMLSIGSKPSILYSDMSTYGPSLDATLWFLTYWLIFALLALFKAGLFWNRGTDKTFGSRIKLAIQELKGKVAVAFYSIVFIWLAVASFVFYNTQILNPYDSKDEYEQMLADYETEYRQYKDLPIPSITDVTFHIDLYPQKRDVKVKAKLKMVNKQAEAIDTLFYVYDESWTPRFEIPNSKEVFHDEEKGILMFELNKVLQQGDTLDIVIHNEFATEGFGNGMGYTDILSNGSFFNNKSILPKLGYQDEIELSDKNTRKKYGFAEKDKMPKLDATCAEACMKNYLTNGTADWVNMQTYISTSEDQIAIAPGSLLKEWNKDGRNYYHYKVDHPTMYFASFTSARYEVKKKDWNGVSIEVYYDKAHGQNIDMMLNAVERSLAYYTENFGAYKHKQARIIEFPRYSSFAQAFAGTMPYSEDLGFIINLEDENDNNIVDAVVAHEMAHQWWAHQVIGARMEGTTLFSEAVSEYSSLMVMKSISDDIKMKEFLKYNFDRYLKGRAHETEKEKPLYKVTADQMYIHYGKGSIILYALQDYIGEEKVNLALRNFLEEYRYKEPPYPTSLDFLRHLEPQVPDSLAYLIDDWFKEITLYDFRMKEASMSKTADDKYRVKMKVDALKLKSDSLGTETEVPINDWVDIGVYADSEEKELIYHKRVKFDQKENTFEFTVDQKPLKAAVDPRRMLIERVIDDNTKKINETEEAELLAQQ